MNTMKIVMFACVISARIFAAAQAPAGEIFSFEKLMGTVWDHDNDNFKRLLITEHGCSKLTPEDWTTLETAIQGEKQPLVEIRKLISDCKAHDGGGSAALITPKVEEIELLKEFASHVKNRNWDEVKNSFASFELYLDGERKTGMMYPLLSAPVLDNRSSVIALFELDEWRFNDLVAAYEDTYNRMVRAQYGGEDSRARSEKVLRREAPSYPVPEFRAVEGGIFAGESERPEAPIHGDTAAATVPAQGVANIGAGCGMSLYVRGERVNVNEIAKQLVECIERGDYASATKMTRNWLGRGLKKDLFLLATCDKNLALINYFRNLERTHPGYIWFVQELGSKEEKIKLAMAMSSDSSSGGGGSGGGGGEGGGR